MADMLTQIQDELDMLLHQMQASLTYIKTRAPPAAIPGQPLLSSFAEHEAQAVAQSQAQAAHSQGQTQSAAQSNPSQPPPTPLLPPSQEDFQKDIKELSRDLLLKEQQIEILIECLPGLDTSEKEQVERMQELERQLEEIEGERMAAVKEKESLVRRVEEKIGSVGGM